MEIDMTTKITQILEITTTDDGEETKKYMIEKDNEWVTIDENEYKKIRGE